MGYDRMVHWENHVGDDVFENPETQARGTWYGVSGIPDVRIDGKTPIIGAGSCSGAATQYRNAISNRLAETGGVSPVSIDGSFLPLGSTVSATATFRLEDPVVLTSLRATLLIYEDHVLWSGDYWEHTERDLYDENITLTNVGDQVTVSYDFAINPSWNIDNIKVVAYLQQTSGNKQMIQGLMVPFGDFSYELQKTIASVPDGNGVAVFLATVTNIGDATDTLTLEPGTPFGSWTTDFLVCGDPNPHSGPFDVVLDPEESCDIQIRVHTDSAVEVRSGSFQVTSAFSERTVAEEMRVFNGSWAILFVDDDRARQDEVPWLAALDAIGVLHDDWDAYVMGSGPTFANMSGYDYVIWQTGFDMLNNTILLPSDEAALASFLDAGGSVFVASPHYINSKTEVTDFMRRYFGIASYTTDVGFTDMYGVAGDPIGNGIHLHLTFSIPAFNKGDAVEPTATAVKCFTASGNTGVCLRNQVTDGGKCVFMPAALHVADNNPDPNNMKTTLQRILDWLEPQPSAGVEDEAAAPLFGSRIDAAQPNPFNPRTQISFTLSQTGASGPVRLEVFDLGGRKVASLFEGTLPAGEHVR
ncbi:MAG: hypothetical protein ACE15D_15370, partial [Candidatus Eisenbacteria bacterium]